MKQCIHQNYLLEYPKPTSLKTSPLASTNINKSSHESSLDNFNFEHLLITGDNALKDKPRKIPLIIPLEKRLSLQPKPLQILSASKKVDQRHRNSWCLMRNLVRGLHYMTTPEILSIRDEVLYYIYKGILFYIFNLKREFEMNINDEKLSPKLKKEKSSQQFSHESIIEKATNNVFLV